MLKKITILISLCFVSCAQLNQRSTGVTPAKNEANESLATNTGDKRSKKIAVVLGPGGLKTLAHIGVLKNMDKERLQIAKVVGLEWGAAIAAVYARKGKTHDLEWQMSKLKEEHLPKPGFFKNNVDLENPNRLNLFFEKVFQAHNIANSEVPFFCPTALGDRLSWLKSGPVYKELKKCVAYPPLFYSYNGWRAAPFALEESIQQIRDSGDYTIVFIDVLSREDFKRSNKTLDQEAEKLLWRQIKKETKAAAKLADYYVPVTTSEFHFLDFKNIRKLIAKGEAETSIIVKRIAGEVYGNL